ncbi:MAG: DUF2878 domain-containing protein [Acidobacteriota bacterium]
MSLRFRVLNSVLFNLIWFACLLGPGWGLPWLGPVSTAAWLVVHFRYVHAPRPEGWLLLVAGLLGYVTDSTLTAFGILQFPDEVRALSWFGPTTTWMISLWVAFAATLYHSWSWVRHLGLAAIFGGVFAPLSYLAGERLGVVTIDGKRGVAFIAIAWLLVLPTLVFVRDRLLPTGQLPPEATVPPDDTSNGDDE